MSADLVYALEQIEKEKGISKDVIVESIEIALVSAYKKNFGVSQNVTVKFDNVTGEFRVFALKKITLEPKNPLLEVSLEEARGVDGNLSEEDYLEVEVTPRRFGRIAAQTAKQVVMQRLRDAEKGMIFEQFVSKEEEIVSGIVRRFEKKNIVIELDRAEAIIPLTDQVPSEKLNFNDRVKIYVLEVKKLTKGLQIIGSRTNPGLVKRLFELEVPEIADGTVEIRSISREAGSRTKIAVYSKEENVDPVGACVGQKGNRVQAIVDELKDEKIDIIKWSSDPAEYIASSLSPAKVFKVDIIEGEKSAKVIVPDFQLSLAIGKEGQNARLAAKLTGWKIDIKSQSQMMGQLFGEGTTSEVSKEEYQSKETGNPNLNDLFVTPKLNQEEIIENDQDAYYGEEEQNS